MLRLGVDMVGMCGGLEDSERLMPKSSWTTSDMVRWRRSESALLRQGADWGVALCMLRAVQVTVFAVSAWPCRWDGALRMARSVRGSGSRFGVPRT